MAQSTLHFSCGMAAGTLAVLPKLRRAWQTRDPLAPVVVRWIIFSYTLGLFATLPAIYRHFFSDGTPANAWWSNIFLLYGLIEKLPLPSIGLGEICAAAIFALQYGLMLAAIYRYSKPPRLFLSSSSERSEQL